VVDLLLTLQSTRPGTQPTTRVLLLMPANPSRDDATFGARVPRKTRSVANAMKEDEPRAIMGPTAADYDRLGQ